MTNIYVGNLDFTASEDQLRTLFAAYGAVKTVTIVTDRDTGEPRGFAFVEMTTAGQAQDAIRALNGSVQGGRTLMVNEARPKLYSNRERESLAGRDHRRHRVSLPKISSACRHSLLEKLIEATVPAAMQRRSGSQSRECREQSGLGS